MECSIMKRLSLKAGYCGSRCVLERSECDEGVSWNSPAEMEGGPYRAHGGYCLLAESVREMALGSCGSGGACAPNEESCGDGAGVDSARFGYDGYCTAEGTTFGRCGAENNDGRCSWSPDDCDEGEDWTFPAEGCTYDKVRVGGCVGDGVVYCAVSHDGCDDGSTHLNPLEVAKRTGVECYLGMEITDPVAPGAEAGEDREGATLEITYPVEDKVAGDYDGGGAGLAAGAAPEPSSAAASSSPNDGNSGVPVAVGATVGGVAAAALLLYASVLLRRRTRTRTDKLQRMDSTSMSTGLPPSVEVASEGDDAVSNLDVNEFQIGES